MNPQNDSNDVASGDQEQNAHDPPAPQVVADNALGGQSEPMTGLMGPPPGDPFPLTNTLNPAEAELDPTRNVAWWMQESDSLGLLGGLDLTQVQQAARVVTRYRYGLGNLHDFQSIFAAPGQQPEEVQNPQPTETAQAKPIPSSDNQLLADITAYLDNGRDQSQPAENMPPLVTWNTTGLPNSTLPRTRPQQLQQTGHREASPQTTIIDPRYSGQQSPGAGKRPIDDASEITPRKKPTVVSKAASEYGAAADSPIKIDSSPVRGNALGLESAGITALPQNQPLGQLNQGPQPQSHPPATDMFQFMGNDEATMPPPANNQPRSVTTPNSRRGTPRTRTAGPTTPTGTAATPTTRTSEAGAPRRVATTPTNRTFEPATPEGAATPRARTSVPGTPRGPATPRAWSPGPSTPRNGATPRGRATESRTPREAVTPREHTPRQPTSRGGSFATGSPRARTARTGTPRRPSRASEQASPPQFILEEPTGTENLNIAPAQRPASEIRALLPRPDAQGLLGAPIQAPLPAGGNGSPLLQVTPPGRHCVPRLGLGGLDVSARQGYASHPGYGQTMTPAEYHAAVAARTNTIGMGGAPVFINTSPNSDPTGQLNNPQAHIANIQNLRRIAAPGHLHHQPHPMQNLMAPSQTHRPGLSQEPSEYLAELRARLEARVEADARARAQSGHTQSDDYEQEQARAARAIPENLLRYSRQQAAMALTRGNMDQALNSRPAPQPTSFQEALAPVHIPGTQRSPSHIILPSQAPSPLTSHSPHAPVQGEQGQGYQSLQRPPNTFPNLYKQALGLLGPTENRPLPIVTRAVQSNPNAQDNISTTQNNGATTHGGFTTLAPNHAALQMPMHIRGHEEMGGYTHQVPGYDVPGQRGPSTGAGTQAFMPDIQGAQARVQGNFQVPDNTNSSPLRIPDVQGQQAPGQGNIQAALDNTDFAPPQMQMPRESISGASAISQMSDPSLAWSGSSLAAQSQSQAPTPAFTGLENFYGDMAVAQQQEQHNQNQMLGQGAESGSAPVAVKNTAGLGLVGATGEAGGAGAGGGDLGMWDLDGDGNGQPAQTFDEFMNNLLGMGQ